MMRTTRTDHLLFPTASLDSSAAKTDRKDVDSVSYSSLNFEDHSGLHYLANHQTNTYPNHRRTANRHANTTVSTHQESYDHGLMINTSFFDGHLFQPSRSSYILDYNDTPKDLNQFLAGHRMSAESSQLDPHLFKLSFILTLSDWHKDKEVLLDYCPREENDESLLREINAYKQLCFPELNSKQKNGGNLINDSSTYVFTRTLSNGQVEYGYCRRMLNDSNQKSQYPIVICIVSSYTYFKLYDAILNELTAAYATHQLECSLLIQSFYSKPLPVPMPNSSGIVCILNDRRIFFYVCPRDDRLNHDYFSTLLSCLSPNHVVHLFESMLLSKRILCFSNSLSKLTKCCLALSLLMYPFVWPYSFVSLMPSSWLQDLLDSPCPYIYGCLHGTMSHLPSSLDKETLRVDLDSNTIDIGLEEGFLLPLDLRQTLEASLEYIVRFRLGKLNASLMNIAVSEACLRVFVELFYRLPEFFKRLPSSRAKSADRQRSSSVYSTSFQRYDSGIDLQSVVSGDTAQEPVKNEHQSEESRLGYDFRSDEFLLSQPTSAYVTFLNDFIHGMIFLKFLDDYQRPDDPSTAVFSVFAQRLKERRRMTMDELSINAVLRFRQTFDILEKQIKHASRSVNPLFSKFVKKFLE